MQEINLLRSQIKDTALIWQRRNRIFTSIFVLILILEIGLAILFFLMAQTTKERKAAVAAENKQTQNQINESQAALVPAKAFQAQLQNLKALVDNHVYWSGFFEELARHTFIKAKFGSVQTDGSGRVHLEGQVNNYADLAKLLLGLSASEKFHDVELLSSGPTKSEEVGVLFSVDVGIDTDLLRP